MSEVTKVVSAENAPINSSMNYAKKYEAKYEDSGGSGDDLFFVHVTGDDTYQADKTLAEIQAASEAGKVVVVSYYGNAYFANYIGETEAIFDAYILESVNKQQLQVWEFVVTADSVTFEEYDYTLTPDGGN